MGSSESTIRRDTTVKFLIDSKLILLVDFCGLVSVPLGEFGGIPYAHSAHETAPIVQ
jgi:hypothetical protein